MHAWLDFLTNLQKFTSFAYSWSTSEEYLILGAAVHGELYSNDCSYQIEKYKNSRLVVILHCLNSFQHNNYVAVHYLYVLLRENHKINAVCFPSFHNWLQSHM